MGSREDRDYDAKRDAAIERGEVCTDCGAMIDCPYQRAPSRCDDCIDDDEEEPEVWDEEEES